jgi:hypothetical protein
MIHARTQGSGLTGHHWQSQTCVARSWIAYPALRQWAALLTGMRLKRLDAIGAHLDVFHAGAGVGVSVMRGKLTAPGTVQDKVKIGFAFLPVKYEALRMARKPRAKTGIVIFKNGGVTVHRGRLL